jgi:hypothetical protein
VFLQKKDFESVAELKAFGRFLRDRCALSENQKAQKNKKERNSAAARPPSIISGPFCEGKADHGIKLSHFQASFLPRSKLWLFCYFLSIIRYLWLKQAVAMRIIDSEKFAKAKIVPFQIHLTI